MPKLLHIIASPRDRSASTAVAKHFVAAYLSAHPGDTAETYDLWQAGLPEFDGATIDAKYAILHGQKHTPEQLQAWQNVTKIISRAPWLNKHNLPLQPTFLCRPSRKVSCRWDR